MVFFNQKIKDMASALTFLFGVVQLIRYFPPVFKKASNFMEAFLFI